MATTRHKPEEIVTKLRQVEVLVGQGMARVDAIREVPITEQAYYRWRKQYGGMGTDQLKELKRLPKENERLRTAVSDLTLDKLILTEAAKGYTTRNDITVPWANAHRSRKPSTHRPQANYALTIKPDHSGGADQKFDGTSRDLKQAIEDGARIIITTIQKFGTEHLQAISGQSSKNFAVIIDEAHSSQSGKAAQAMADALTREATSSDDIEDLILAHQAARGPQKNISFLAFTATPRNVTLERFGRIGSDGKPHPFHMYSMRQAIEEGFILDVLQNYMTYKAYYQLEKTIEDDPAFKGRKAHTRVARYASLHPTAIDQKVEVIVEHFRRHVAKELGGKAKAMVVTQSREHALRYWQQINRYIEDKGYAGLKALVAFSGDLENDGVSWTEATANGFAETELPKRFDGDEFQILVVAEKYQTGFDQPKLVAMYVDKKLANLQAVQTLARLNRMHPGKDKTFVLDFQNTMEEVKEAFAQFFEATELEERTDLNQIYDLEQRISSASYIATDEVERFAEWFFKGSLSTQDRLELEGTVRLAVERFVLDEDEAQQEEFRQLLKSFQRFYSFVAQVVSLNDAWLEKLYAYTSWLSRLLPSRDVPADITITDDMLTLSAFKLQKDEEGSASLAKGETKKLDPITEFGANPYTEEEEKSLSEIIDSDLLPLESALRG